jgi:docosahexaenoic acid omega-hydroxylase
VKSETFKRTFQFQGHETSANAMSHTILMLAMHPEIQDKVVAELKSVFKTQDSNISPDNLKELVYLEQTIKEAMRMITVVPLYCRRVVGDITLSK